MRVPRFLLTLSVLLFTFTFTFAFPTNAQTESQSPVVRVPDGRHKRAHGEYIRPA